jgi:hypothetical protein
MDDRPPRLFDASGRPISHPVAPSLPPSRDAITLDRALAIGAIIVAVAVAAAMIYGSGKSPELLLIAVATIFVLAVHPIWVKGRTWPIRSILYAVLTLFLGAYTHVLWPVPPPPAFHVLWTQKAQRLEGNGTRINVVVGFQNDGEAFDMIVGSAVAVAFYGGGVTDETIIKELRRRARLQAGKLNSAPFPYHIPAHQSDVFGTTESPPVPPNLLKALNADQGVYAYVATMVTKNDGGKTSLEICGIARSTQIEECERETGK